jgi:hypothetical protein
VVSVFRTRGTDLFTNNFHGFASNRSPLVQQTIKNLSIDVVLSNTDEVLLEHILQKHGCDLPTIDDAGINIEQADTNHQGHPATVYILHIPFEGDQNLLFVRPTTFGLNNPYALIEDKEILIGFGFQYYAQKGRNEDAHAQEEAKEANKLFDEQLKLIRQNLKQLAADVELLHQGWARTLRDSNKLRRDKAQKDQLAAKTIGYPIRKREDAQTYSPPIKRKKLSPPLQTKPGVSNAVLEMAKYEEILRTISHMSRVIERNPTAFETMGEEDLRHFFLLMLNAIYEGRATGETFNSEGKTDILIREDDKNIFIAECKFWGGAKLFTGTINQLMGYQTWHDTKTAVIIFNRNKGFTAVLDQIPEIVRAHPNYKQPGKTFEDKTYTQYVFTHQDDPQKEFLLTVIAFDVPVNKP